MQLRIQRSQRTGGIVGKTVFFCLDVRADYSPEEQDNIQKYKLGSQGIYNSRAAKKHLDTMDAQLSRVDSKSAGEQFAGLARGAVSLVMAKMNLNITIASLGKGHHVECKDLEELLETEDTVRTACKSVTRYLEVADTFNGSEVVIEYEKGEERVHTTQGAVPLLTATLSDTASTTTLIDSDRSSGGLSSFAAQEDSGKFDLLAKLRDFWNSERGRKIVYVAGGIIVLIILLRSCS